MLASHASEACIYWTALIRACSMYDLLTLNPGISGAQPGARPALPCYPLGPATEFGYYGSDVAFGHFTGGNEDGSAGAIGGAMAAARVNGALLNTYNPRDMYRGSLANNSLESALQPTYWFVDLLAPFQVKSVGAPASAASGPPWHGCNRQRAWRPSAAWTASCSTHTMHAPDGLPPQISTVLLAVGAPMENASLYVGSDPSSVFANALVKVRRTWAALLLRWQREGATSAAAGAWVESFRTRCCRRALPCAKESSWRCLWAGRRAATLLCILATQTRLADVLAVWPCLVGHFKLANGKNRKPNTGSACCNPPSFHDLHPAEQHDAGKCSSVLVR